MKKILHTALSWISTLAVVIMFFLAYGSVENRWYRVITVDGNSMSPVLWYGDLMVVTPVDGEIPVNSIIVMNIQGSLVTHRLVDYDESGRPITKGDANEVIDKFSNPDLNIVGIFRLRLPGLGYPLMYLNQLLHKS